MDRKITIVVLIVFICLIAGAAAIVFNTNTNVNNNSTNDQNGKTNTNTSNTTTVSGIQVIATQTGPSTAYKGNNITVNYNVSNTGNQTVYNVKAYSQNFNKTLGTIKAGASKSFQYSIHIPTDKEIQADFGANSTVSNPFYIGGFAVIYEDAKGSSYSLNSNKLEIKLL